jgi:hypothetical protein
LGVISIQDDEAGLTLLSTVCSYSGGDMVLCGVRDIGGDFDLSVTEFINSASRATIKLKTRGGAHRAEGVVYEL